MPRKMNPSCAGGCGRDRVLGPDFYVDRNGIPRQKCKHCLKFDAAKWRREHPEVYKAIYRRANHKANLKSRFGLTVEEYNALVSQTDGRCGICRLPETRNRRMCLDHDHETGVLRGFLCSRCNLLLGQARDDVGRLKLAIQYLESRKPLRTSDLDPPVPMILVCPLCHAQHIDKGEFATRRHTTHACQECGTVWRPAIVETVGVQFLPGFKDAD